MQCSIFSIITSLNIMLCNHSLNGVTDTCYIYPLSIEHYKHQDTCPTRIRQTECPATTVTKITTSKRCVESRTAQEYGDAIFNTLSSTDNLRLDLISSPRGGHNHLLGCVEREFTLDSPGLLGRAQNRLQRISYSSLSRCRQP